MKILFFIDSLTSGGKERRLIELMKGIKFRSDIQFEIVIMSPEIHYKEVFDLNIKIHYLIRKTKKGISSFQKFYRICKIYKPDIVHCWDSMTAIIAASVCKLLHIKLVNGLVVDTPVKQNVFNKYWLRAQLSFPFSNIIIGNSHAGLKAYKTPAKKSLCIYNGMDLRRFNNLKDSSLMRKEIFGDANGSFFVIGMVAAFEDRKDYYTLIRAAIGLIPYNANVKFVLIGDGPNFEKIKGGIPCAFLNNFFFLGKRTDVESVINIFDIGILLTNTKVHGEGISNSIIEYMALGKPVIATRGGGTTEVVIDSKNGYLIDLENHEQLIEKIKKLMDDKKLMQHFGNEGNYLVREKFDLKIMTNKYIDMYHNLITK